MICYIYLRINERIYLKNEESKNSKSYLFNKIY